MMPLVAEALGFERPIDAEVDTGGRGLASGSFVAGFTAGATHDDSYAAEPIVSSEGLCAVATPAELSRAGPARVRRQHGLQRGMHLQLGRLERLPRGDGRPHLRGHARRVAPDLPAGRRAGGARRARFQLRRGPLHRGRRERAAGHGHLARAAPEGVDALLQARRIGELLLPRLDRLVLAEPAPTPATPPGASFCDSLSLLDLNRRPAVASTRPTVTPGSVCGASRTRRPGSKWSWPPSRT